MLIDQEPKVGEADCGAATPFSIGVQDTTTHAILGKAPGSYTPGTGNCKSTATLKNVAPATEYVFYVTDGAQTYELDRIFGLSIYANTVHVKVFNSGFALIS